jgi:hypothetical protein
MISAVEKLRKSDAEWDARAIHSAIEAARDLIGNDRAINGRAPVGTLSEATEWNWIAHAIVFGWINVKAQQAVTEGLGYDAAIMSMVGSPGPDDAGTVAAILPKLGELEDVPWDKPISEWSKTEIIRFTWNAFLLIGGALTARDKAIGGLIAKPSANARARMERTYSAAQGGPLLSSDEMNDDVPF